jgi:hypothetical protein
MCVKFAHLDCKLEFKLFSTTKINYHTTTLEPITKHLVAKDINKLCLSMDE